MYYTDRCMLSGPPTTWPCIYVARIFNWCVVSFTSQKGGDFFAEHFEGTRNNREQSDQAINLDKISLNHVGLSIVMGKPKMDGF